MLGTPLNLYENSMTKHHYYLHLINEKTKTPIRLYKLPALPQPIKDEARI